MSRSNKTDLRNPSKYFIEWSSTDKSFFRYNKEHKEDPTKEKFIEFKLPFGFIVLDRLACVKGYNQQLKVSYYSNEVRNVSTDKIIVRSKNGVEAEGTYKEVMEKLKSKGAKYTQSVYIAFKEGEEFIIANLQITGSALSTWINFCKTNDPEKGGVIVRSTTEGVNGAVKFNCPVYQTFPLKPEVEAKAMEMDKEVQEFLDAYFKRGTLENSKESLKDANFTEEPITTAQVENTTHPVETTASESDDLPF